MPFPVGAITKTLVIEPGTDGDGVPQSVEVLVTSPLSRVIWANTDTPVEIGYALVRGGQGQTVEIPLLVTDQPGLVDDTQNPITFWSYTVKVRYLSGATGRKTGNSVVKVVQPIIADPARIQFSNIASGTPVPVNVDIQSYVSMAENAANVAVAANLEIAGSRITAVQAANTAVSSATSAGQSATNAATSASTAGTSAFNAGESASIALGHANDAAASAVGLATARDAAAGSASAASGSASAAAGSASAAAGSAASAATALTSVSTAADTARADVAATAATAQTNIAASAALATSAKTAAETARDLAAGSATAANASATSAAASNSDATGHDQAASQSALTASEALSALQALISGFNGDMSGKQSLTEKGQAGGYASLDSGGRVPWEQLPSTLLRYKGVWNANSNTPNLVDGLGQIGETYKVTATGTITVNLGSGAQDFTSGDLLIYNGTRWEKSDTTDSVTSVAGKIGVVLLDKTDVGLPNVNNTADLDKPVSTATQTAINATITSVSLSGRNLLFTTVGGSQISAGTVVPDFTIGTVTTLAAGASATATITGSTPDKVLSLGLPQGVKGDPGDLTAASSSTWTGSFSLGTPTVPETRVRTLTGNVTFTAIGSPPATQSFTLTLVLTQDITGSRTITWPASVKWSEGVIPQPSAAPNSISLFHLFWTGASWLGAKAGQNFA
jgi:hypothetical protein